MPLTSRATAYLRQQEWRAEMRHTPEVLTAAFSQAGLVPSESVLAFQRAYAGLVVYAALEPICFGLLHPQVQKRWFASAQTSYHLDLHEPDAEVPVYHFGCAMTGYQEYFTLDEQGAYYEGWKKHASSFDGVVEDLAVFAEIQAVGYTQQYSRELDSERLSAEVLRTELGVTHYPSFPDDIISWAGNDKVLVRRSPAELRLFAREAVDSALLNRCDQLLHRYA
jgi:hypothetical protein